MREAVVREEERACMPQAARMSEAGDRKCPGSLTGPRTQKLGSSPVTV